MFLKSCKDLQDCMYKLRWKGMLMIASRLLCKLINYPIIRFHCFNQLSKLRIWIEQTPHESSVACIIRTRFRNTGRWALPDVLKYAVFQKSVTFSPPFRSVFGLWDVSRSACGLVRRLAGSQGPWRLQAFEEGWAARPSSNHPAGLWGITDVRGGRCEWHSNAPAVNI